jgi:hypothetical protein
VYRKRKKDKDEFTFFVCNVQQLPKTVRPPVFYEEPIEEKTRATMQELRPDGGAGQDKGSKQILGSSSSASGGSYVMASGFISTKNSSFFATESRQPNQRPEQRQENQGTRGKGGECYQQPFSDDASASNAHE